MHCSVIGFLLTFKSIQMISKINIECELVNDNIIHNIQLKITLGPLEVLEGDFLKYIFLKGFLSFDILIIIIPYNIFLFNTKDSFKSKNIFVFL